MTAIGPGPRGGVRGLWRGLPKVTKVLVIVFGLVAILVGIGAVGSHKAKPAPLPTPNLTTASPAPYQNLRREDIPHFRAVLGTPPLLSCAELRTLGQEAFAHRDDFAGTVISDQLEAQHCPAS